MKTIVRKASIGFFISALFFLVLEGILWGFALLQDKDWRVDPLPKHPTYQVLCEFGDMLTLCPDQGMDYERVHPEIFFAEPKSKRVIAIGESFVYGLGLEKEQSWPAQMQAFLGADVEILNLARCGTYASRLIPIVEAAIELKPDAIVLSVGNNEHTMTSFYSGRAGRYPLLSYRLSSWMGGLQFYGVLLRSLVGAQVRVTESFTETPDEFEREEDRLAYAARRRPPNLSVFPNSIASRSVTQILEEEQRLKEMIFRQHLQEMIELIKAAKIEIVLTTLPRDLLVPPTLSGIHSEDEQLVLQLVQKLQERSPHNKAEHLFSGLEIDDRVSLFLYEAAMMHKNNGDLPEAIQWIEASTSWDLIPDSTPEINQIIRDIAKKEEIPLVDLDRYAQKYFLQPSDIFLDKVHVNQRGANEIAELVSADIRRIWEKE